MNFFSLVAIFFGLAFLFSGGNPIFGLLSGVFILLTLVKFLTEKAVTQLDKPVVEKCPLHKWSRDENGMICEKCKKRPMDLNAHEE